MPGVLGAAIVTLLLAAAWAGLRRWRSGEAAEGKTARRAGEAEKEAERQRAKAQAAKAAAEKAIRVVWGLVQEIAAPGRVQAEVAAVEAAAAEAEEARAAAGEAAAKAGSAGARAAAEEASSAARKAAEVLKFALEALPLSETNHAVAEAIAMYDESPYAIVKGYAPVGAQHPNRYTREPEVTDPESPEQWKANLDKCLADDSCVGVYKGRNVTTAIVAPQWRPGYYPTFAKKENFPIALP